MLVMKGWDVWIDFSMSILVLCNQTTPERVKFIPLLQATPTNFALINMAIYNFIFVVLFQFVLPFFCDKRVFNNFSFANEQTYIVVYFFILIFRTLIISIVVKYYMQYSGYCLKGTSLL